MNRGGFPAAPRFLRPSRIVLIAVIAVLAVVPAVLGFGRPAVPNPQAKAIPTASASFGSPRDVARDPRDVARDALVSEGVSCFRESFRLRRALSADFLAQLSADAQAAGVDHWLVAGGDPWAAGQGWVGSLDGAVAALAGTLVAETPSEGWVLLQREGKPAAIQFGRIDLPNGLTVWLREDVIVAKDC